MSRRKPKAQHGIRRKGHRWEVNVRVKGFLHSTTFDLETSDADMQAWRKAQRANAPSAPAPGVGTLGRDAVRYLRTVQHKPDYPNQRTYLTRWLKHFGTYRRRQSITAVEIETALSQFLLTLGPTTVRHHRTCLLNLWRTLDGDEAPNPVAKTSRPRDPQAVPRSANIEHVRQVLDHLRPSKTRARLMVILTTGLPHRQLMDLQPADWDRTRQILRVSARGKGAGAAGRLLPLSDEGVKAMGEFNRWDAWGAFSQSAMHSAVHRACKALGIPRFRPYDLRHTQGTLLYQFTGDLTTVARMLGHAGTKTTERYTQEAWAELDRSTAAKVGKELAGRLEKPKE